jgi:hypothetical protein
VHSKGMLSMGAALVAAVALVSSSGAGTASSRSAKRIDVSTRASVIHYLRSIHVNPRGVVIQRGARNYAGSKCPGKGWTCTSTAHTVVQVASGGGTNAFRCSTASCAVVQVAAPAATNTAKCIRTTGITQSCSINQTSSGSTNNDAVVVEIATKMSGLTQNASQTAQIVQQSAAGPNRACVLQTATIDGSTVAKKGMPVTVTLDAHQSIIIKQDSTSGSNLVESPTGSGTTWNCPNPDPNPGPLNQAEIISSDATGSAQITQNLNAAGSTPNMSLDIQQNKNGAYGIGTGASTANFIQTNTLSAVASTTSTVGPVNITESSPNGGIDASVNQFSTNGTLIINATQLEEQCARAGNLTPPALPLHGSYDDCAARDTHPLPAGPPAWTETQYGPVRKGSDPSVQETNGSATFNVTQTSNQTNDDGQNQTNTLQGDCQTTGNCSATQNTNIDGSSSTQTQSGTNVSLETNCVGPTCFSESGNQLTATNTDIAEFGYGGMRVNTSDLGTPGDGTGTIEVSGINGPVTKAVLYWNGPTSSSDPDSNAVVSFGGSVVTGTNIGTASSNCWDAPDHGVSYTNSQSYRADVTDIVSAGLDVNGMGSFDLSNFTKSVGDTVVSDINGVALVVFSYDGNSADYRNVVLWSGNDSNEPTTGDPEGWDETLTGVRYPGSGSASLDFVVGDGQSFGDGAITANGIEMVPAGGIFQGEATPSGSGNLDGNLWDIKSFPLPSTVLTGLTPGPASLQVTSPEADDCLSLVVAAANMPAPAPISAPSAAVAATPQLSQPAAVVPRGGAIPGTSGR